MGGKLATVNVARPRVFVYKGRDIESAIWKTPVEGRVAARSVNLEGDDQADRTVHGGPDKAVYAYALEDIRLWESELGRPLGPGAFGENLTTEGLDVTGAVIGERWEVGTVCLEVSEPRARSLPRGWKTTRSCGASPKRVDREPIFASCVKASSELETPSRSRPVRSMA